MCQPVPDDLREVGLLGLGHLGHRTTVVSLGALVEERHRHLHGADPVGEGVVHLLDECSPSVGHLLHHDELPQRSRPVESGHGEGRREVEDVAQRPGSGCALEPQVVVEVEVRVDHELRRCEPERRGGHALAKPWYLPARTLHLVDETLPVERLVEQRHAGDRGPQQRILLDGPHERVLVAHPLLEPDSCHGPSLAVVRCARLVAKYVRSRSGVLAWPRSDAYYRARRVSASPARESAVRPVWRGVLHRWATIVYLPLFVLLVWLASGLGDRLACVVYGIGVLTMLGVSATYHSGRLGPVGTRRAKRLDHATILLAIAASYTAVATVGLDGAAASTLLVAVWIAAPAGMAVRMAWLDAPYPVVAVVYIGVGWIALLEIGALVDALSGLQLALVIGGGLTYTAGGVVYALHRPDPWPASFGYHEIFHALVVGGVTLHYIAVLSLVLQSN